MVSLKKKTNLDRLMSIDRILMFFFLHAEFEIFHAVTCIKLTSHVSLLVSTPNFPDFLCLTIFFLWHDLLLAYNCWAWMLLNFLIFKSLAKNALDKQTETNFIKNICNKDFDNTTW